MPGHRLISLLLAGQLVVWFSGLGSTRFHWVFAPFWLAAAIRASRPRSPEAPSLLEGMPHRSPWRVTAGLTLLFGAAWAGALAGLYFSFGFGAYDLGIYDSIAFNSAHGKFFYSSVQQMNHLGEHFSPVMALFAPLYRLVPTPLWLLLAGLLAYLSVPLVLQRLLRRHGIDERLGPWLALLWFLNAPMASAVKFLFHPSTLAAPFVLLAWDAAARRRWKSLAGWMLFLLLFKESLALAGAGIGLWLLAGRGTRKAGLVLLAASLLAGAVIAGWAIPAIRAEAWTHAARLGPLADIPAKLGYLLLLLLPFSVLHARPRALLPALPLILLNLSTGFAPQYSMQHHYDDLIIPLLFAGALGALAGGGKPLLAGWRPPLAAAVAALCVLLCAPPAPLRIARKNIPTAAHRQARRSLMRLQSEAPVPAGTWFLQSRLLPFVPRTGKTTLDRLDFDNPPADARVVLAPEIAPSFPDELLENAAARLSDSSAFTLEREFPGLAVFRTIH